MKQTQTQNQKQKTTQTSGGKKNEKIYQEGRFKDGFNLVELICVIAIICILAGVLLFNYIGVFRNCMEALGGI
ncbi:MAG: type II secretion system GspH family protein [Saccharofermentans sp.]|nr:type II secretion system GspH family protein [Saccharofermentans sp.]